MSISFAWTNSVSDPRLAARLQKARTSFQEGDLQETLLLLAQAEQYLLCQKNPSKDEMRMLADLRTRIATLQTNKKR